MCSFLFPGGFLPPWTSSDREEVLGVCTAAILPDVAGAGVFGMRIVAALSAFVFLMVCTFPGRL